MGTAMASGYGAGFGRRLQAWRHQNRLTQRQLADVLGYDVTYIAKIEGGARPPTRAFLARLGQVREAADGMLPPPTVGIAEKRLCSRRTSWTTCCHPPVRVLSRRGASCTAGPRRCSAVSACSLLPAQEGRASCSC
jgi:DNA-binding XRE family transcriptional regulator